MVSVAIGFDANAGWRGEALQPGSDDGESFDEWEIVPLTVAGMAEGHNHLFQRRVDFDLVLVLDAEALVGPECLTKLVEGIADPEVGLIEARTLPLPNAKVYDLESGDTSWASITCCLIRQDVLDTIGGYEAGTFPAEGADVDLSWRARLAGWKVRCAPSSAVFVPRAVSEDGFPADGGADYARLQLASKYAGLGVASAWALAWRSRGTPGERAAAARFEQTGPESHVPAPPNPAGIDLAAEVFAITRLDAPADPRRRPTPPQGTRTGEESVATSTLAGGGTGDGGPATEAPLLLPHSIATGPHGTFYVTDNGVAGVRRVDPFGTITTVAGSCHPPTTAAGGPGAWAGFHHPGGLACDPDGALFLVDGLTESVWCLDPDDVPVPVPIGDTVGQAEALAVRSHPDPVLAIADTWNHRLVMLDKDWEPIEVEGIGRPTGVAFAPDGALWVADAWEGSLHRIRRDGTCDVTVNRQDLKTAGGEEVLPVAAIAIDLEGRPCYADSYNHRVARLEVDGSVTVIAGTGRAGFSGDGGPAETAQLNRPTGLSIDPLTGSMLIADTSNHRVRRVTSDGTIDTVAGNSQPGFYGDGGPAGLARLHRPAGVVTIPARDGDVTFVADTGNARLRAITPDGMISTVAPPLSLLDTEPCALASDGEDLLVADRRHHQVWRLTADGLMRLVAGTGRRGGEGDGGPAVEAELDHPGGLAVDSEGRVLIADTRNHRVRVVDNDGGIETIAGSGLCGSRGDGGPARIAELAFPEGLAVEPTGAVLVADSFNHRIRRIRIDGQIETFAGTGRPGDDGDGGPATEAQLRSPTAVLVCSEDGVITVFIADTYNHRVRRVAQDRTITTVAGTGEPDYDGDDGPAEDAALAHPRGLSVGPTGTLLVADSSNDRIRSFRIAP